MNTTTEAQGLAAQQAAGLRALADMIDAHPEVAELIRFSGLERLLAPVGSTDDAVMVMADLIRKAKARGATVTKSAEDDWFNVHVAWGPVGIQVYAAREEVCERVVTGTETVTKTVKDPARLAEVPEIEVTETVETVEWVCRPILAATVDGAA